MIHPEVAQPLPTREMIVHLLKTKGDMSTKELTEELGITVMAVRRHIQSLERDSFITSKMQRQSMGRPTAVYSLTEQAGAFFPNKYHALTIELLTELEEHFGGEAVEKLFVSRKNKLLQKYDDAMHGKSVSERIEMLADLQHENGYMVKLEKIDNEAFVLKEYNCPIEHVAFKYKNACQCELQLFRSLLTDAEVNRTECLSEGGQCCSYMIRKKEQR